MLVFTFTSTTRASDAKLVALTFDDGPRPYVLFGSNGPTTAGLLDISKAKRCQGDFFWGGLAARAGNSPGEVVARER